jgi:hypothetical protein
VDANTVLGPRPFRYPHAGSRSGARSRPS